MVLKIQEVSEKIKVPRSTIRFWESAFPEVINPSRTNGGQRRYTDKDVIMLLNIKKLVHHMNKSINDARAILNHGNTDFGKIDWQNQSI